MDIFSKFMQQTAGQKHYIEDSIALRLVSSAMSIIGAIAACTLAETPLWLMMTALPAIIIGSWLSYKRRNENNFVGKLWISAGILLVATVFFKELLVRLNLSVADARIPLTNMLIALQALHCFDLPRRRDLGLSAIVGLTLLASAATLSHDTSFGIYLFVFCALGIMLLRFDCVSRTGTRATSLSDAVQRIAARRKKGSRQFAPAIGGVLAFAVGSVGLFAIMPRADISILRHVRVSGGLDLSFLKDPSMSPFLKGLISGDGSIKSNPNAYYGFAETLDTNYRGELSDEIVLRVTSPIGTYWRGMAYDTFDGVTWSMNRPKPCTSRVCRDGLMIDLCPVPGLDLKGGDLCPSDPSRWRDLTQVFYVEANGSNLVVCAPIPYQIYFPAPNLQLDHYGALRSPVGVEKEMVYTVISHMPYRDATALSARIVDPEQVRRLRDRFSNYLQVPPGVDSGVQKLADRVAGDGSWYQQAGRICDHLQKSYKYDLNVAPARRGRDTVSEFLLDRKKGFCEQFATAFCVMCRLKGIPARLVTGYMPGSYNALTGMWDIRLSDAHCWGEIFVPKSGWVALDPTPGGLDGAFDGIEQRSTWSFFAENLEKIVGDLSRQPVIQGLGGLGRSALEGAVRLTGQLGNLGGISVLVAAVITAVIWRRRLVKQPVADPGPKGDQVFIDPSTNASMKQVLQDLTVLKVVREPSDTLTDVLTKTRVSLHREISIEKPDCDGAVASNNVRMELQSKFLGELEGFFDDYARRRYGGKHGDASLKELSQSLRRMIGILSKVE